MAEEKKSSDWLQRFTPLLAVLVAFSGATFQLFSDKKSNSVEFSGKLIKRIETLEASVSQLQAKIAEKDGLIYALRLENLSLKDQVKYQHEQGKTLRAMLVDMPLAAWIKKKTINSSGEVIPVMVFVNREYENVFGISAKNYEGRPDHEVWPERFAKIFREQDIRVFDLRSADCEIQTFPGRMLEPNPPLITKNVCKWHVDLGNGEEGAAGMLLPIE